MRQKLATAAAALTLLFCTLTMTEALAQDCTPQDITLSSQDDVDNFDSNCDTVTGNLVIDAAAIENLDGLSALTAVEGNLRFSNASENSINFDSLSSLTRVGGELRISGNASLTDINGLSSLTSVGGLHISANSLTNIDGLSSLTSVEGNLQISAMSGLSNIDGLSSLTSVGGNLQISALGGLLNIDGLSSLTNVGGDFSIRNNDDLESCAGAAPVLGWPDNIPYDAGRDLVSGSVGIANGDEIPGPSSPDDCLTSFFPFLYSVSEPDATATITGRDTRYPFKNLIIPTTIEIDGNPYVVTSIGGLASFEGPKAVSIAIPNSVTSIGQNALYLNALTTLEIPAGVNSLGFEAFARNLLTNVAFKGDYPAFGATSEAFRDNPDLTTITYCEGATGWDDPEPFNVGNFSAPIEITATPVACTTPPVTTVPTIPVLACMALGGLIGLLGLRQTLA